MGFSLVDVGWPVTQDVWERQECATVLLLVLLLLLLVPLARGVHGFAKPG
jgi:hypothetical protein